MILLTVSLFAICHGFKGRAGRVNRVEGAVSAGHLWGYSIHIIASVVAI